MRSDICSYSVSPSLLFDTVNCIRKEISDEVYIQTEIALTAVYKVLHVMFCYLRV